MINNYTIVYAPDTGSRMLYEGHLDESSVFDGWIGIHVHHDGEQLQVDSFVGELATQAQVDELLNATYSVDDGTRARPPQDGQW